MGNSQYTIRFSLASDAAFGRGDGVAGLINQEVQHDIYGCPFLGGKAIKGILVNECADILDALSAEKKDPWDAVALALFGRPGGGYASRARLHVGDATLPQPLRQAIRDEIEINERLTATAVLGSLTAIRRQTAINNDTGAADDASLRAIRVILRDTTFEAPIWLTDPISSPEKNNQPTNEQLLRLLSACLMAFRRAGTNRNRGLGRLTDVQLYDADDYAVTDDYFEAFATEVLV